MNILIIMSAVCFNVSPPDIMIVDFYFVNQFIFNYTEFKV